MAKKILPITTRTREIDATIKTILENPNLFVPMTVDNCLECIKKLPFNFYFMYSKFEGLYAVSNRPLDQETAIETDFSGANFTILDYTLESAMGRAIHYYYHSKVRD